MNELLIWHRADKRLPGYNEPVLGWRPDWAFPVMIYMDGPYDDADFIWHFCQDNRSLGDMPTHWAEVKGPV